MRGGRSEEESAAVASVALLIRQKIFFLIPLINVLIFHSRIRAVNFPPSKLILYGFDYFPKLPNAIRRHFGLAFDNPRPRLRVLRSFLSAKSTGKFFPCKILQYKGLEPDSLRPREHSTSRRGITFPLSELLILRHYPRPIAQREAFYKWL